VKAAISLVFFFAMSRVEGQSISKDSFHKSITIKRQNISFEDVLHQLSTQTKLYFIYSSNSVELHKLLSLSIEQLPLPEVLEKLSRIMHVTFRREGHYVIVKATSELKRNGPDEQVLLVQDPKSSTKSTVSKVANLPIGKTTKAIREIDHRLFIPHNLLKKNLLNCESGFIGLDTAIVKKYFPLNITNPRPKRLVFTSFGLLVNEYSGGVEIHVGLPSLYAVANAGVMRDGYFRNGFGLGTSIPVKPMVTLNPIYTFATLRDKQDYVIDNSLNLVLKDGLKLVGKHHQLKFLFQVQVSKRIRMHVGPSFNFLKTSYTYQKDKVLYSDIVTSSVPASSSGYYVRPAQSVIIRSIYYSPPSDYVTSKSWVGFEAGISYSIKFPHR
jgi:hypothetical protein